MESDKVSALKKLFEENGQGHLFKYFDSYTDEQKTAYIIQLEAIDPVEINDVNKCPLSSFSCTKTSALNHTLMILMQLLNLFKQIRLSRSQVLMKKLQRSTDNSDSKKSIKEKVSFANVI
jgi:hypothetical protein